MVFFRNFEGIFEIQKQSAVGNAEVLQAWLKGRKDFDGGIAVQDGPNGWKINRNAKYSYDKSMKGWEVFDLKIQGGAQLA